MDSWTQGLTLYDVLLEAIQFDSDDESVQSTVLDLLSRSPKEAKKARRTLSFLLSNIVLLRRQDLLRFLLQEGIIVDASAVKSAAEMHFEPARDYLELLFKHGWDINKPLSNTESPVLRYVLPLGAGSQSDPWQRCTTERAT